MFQQEDLLEEMEVKVAQFTYKLRKIYKLFLISDILIILKLMVEEEEEQIIVQELQEKIILSKFLAGV